jgi:hypothetical protein
VDLSLFPAEIRGHVRDVVFSAYVAGFRSMMLTCAALAAVGALLAGVLVEKTTAPREP